MGRLVKAVRPAESFFGARAEGGGIRFLVLVAVVAAVLMRDGRFLWCGVAAESEYGRVDRRDFSITLTLFRCERGVLR